MKKSLTLLLTVLLLTSCINKILDPLEADYALNIPPDVAEAIDSMENTPLSSGSYYGTWQTNTALYTSITNETASVLSIDGSTYFSLNYQFDDFGTVSWSSNYITGIYTKSGNLINVIGEQTQNIYNGSLTTSVADLTYKTLVPYVNGNDLYQLYYILTSGSTVAPGTIMETYSSAILDSDVEDYDFWQYIAFEIVSANQFVYTEKGDLNYNGSYFPMNSGPYISYWGESGGIYWFDKLDITDFGSYAETNHMTNYYLLLNNEVMVSCSSSGENLGDVLHP